MMPSEHDLPAPQVNSDVIPTPDEEITPKASALTVAAATSAAMPEVQVVATLKKVSNNPSIFFARELPAPVE